VGNRLQQGGYSGKRSPQPNFWQCWCIHKSV
jgi:hypothetical protein